MVHQTRTFRQILLIGFCTCLTFGGFLAPISVSNLAYPCDIIYNRSQILDSTSKSEDRSLPSTHNIEMPYYKQTHPVWCGPACIEMLFDYYGPHIDQSVIASVTGYDSFGTYALDLLRASHYSFMSDMTNVPPVGYGVRRLGYHAYSQHWTGNFSSISNSVKTLLSEDIPILILTYYDASHENGHFRVLKGYNDSSNVFIAHDPWYTGQYQGPDETFNQTLLIDDLWTCYDRWGMIIQPMELEISCDDSIIQVGGSFAIETAIISRCPEPFSRDEFPLTSTYTRIHLPPGFRVAQGSEIIPIDLNSEIQEVDWLISAPSLLMTNTVNITVEAGGYVSGVGVNVEAYTDIVGAEVTITLSTLPGMDSSFVIIIAAVGAAIIIIVLIIVKKRFSKKTEGLVGS